MQNMRSPLTTHSAYIGIYTVITSWGEQPGFSRSCLTWGAEPTHAMASAGGSWFMLTNHLRLPGVGLFPKGTPLLQEQKLLKQHSIGNQTQKSSQWLPHEPSLPTDDPFQGESHGFSPLLLLSLPATAALQVPASSGSPAEGAIPINVGDRRTQCSSPEGAFPN